MYHTPMEECEITPRPERRGQRLDRVQRPRGQMWTVEAVAFALRRSQKTIYNRLYKHRELFGRTYYDQDRSRRLIRLLSNDDYEVLRAMFPVRVK